MSDRFTTEVVTGGANVSADTAEAIGKAALQLETLAKQMEEAKDTDTARFTALKAEVDAQAATLSQLKEKHDAEIRDADIAQATATAKAAMEMAQNTRSASKAHLIGMGSSSHPMSGYVPGSFIAALDTWNRRDVLDADRVSAKATLERLGSAYLTPEEAGSKATLGTTDALGGWLVPNATVEPLTKPGRFRPGIMSLVTTRRGLGDQYQIDIPFRRASTTKAVVAPWGQTKENRDLTYEGYTATLYTLAAIYDVSKQFLRKSRGAAEADVMEELQDAFNQGESYYTLRGSGSSEPYGLQTALALGGASAYTSAFSAATTLAGSVAKAIATAAGVMAQRDRTPTGALLSGTGYWEMISQGADAAGFWLAGQQNGTPEGIRPGTLISPFGIPVTYDNQMTGSDDLIVGDFTALKVYFGEGFRVDSSDVAGTRWDTNLVGFRGEEEIGLDARPAVFSGAFQFIADIIP